MTILGIDPGTTQSAWVLYDIDTAEPLEFGLWPNEKVVDIVRQGLDYDELVIEEVRSYGMAVGRDVFETVKWSGRFAEAARPLPVYWLGRIDVKSHLCHSAKANDSNIRAALIDRWPDEPRTAAGRPAKGSVLYGISKDVWAALGVAVTWADKEAKR